MRIVQLSSSASTGGAAIAANRLHVGLLSLGVESELLVSKGGEGEKSVLKPTGFASKIASRLVPVLDRLPGQLAGLSSDRISSSWVPDRLVPWVKSRQPDIINLHWVNDGYMRIETLPRFDRPLVWTLHDMWALAGGEHYVGDSARYKDGYRRENRPNDGARFDVNRWIWERKFRAWRNIENLTIACPSRWLSDCVKKSPIFEGFRVEILPNGVDHKRFHPIDHVTVRRILGLPTNKKLILFGAGSATSDPRKGYSLLLEALSELNIKNSTTDYELVVFGASSAAHRLSMPVHFLGNLFDSISMALVYAACDVFVAPSLEDNLPNTVLEALSCGTPVVSFNIGGFPDMITHKKEGYLAQPFNTSDMANGISWVMENDERWQVLSLAARDRIVREFTLETSACRYQKLYWELLDENSKH